LKAGCSNGDDSAGSDRATSTAATTSVTSVVVTAPTANADTIDTCRSLAINEPLRQFWHEMNNGGTVMGTLAVQARLAVMNFGRYASDPDLDADVAAVMSNAVEEMGDMNQERAGGASFDSYLDPATRAAGCGRRPDEAGLSTNEIVDRIGNTLAVVERHYRPKRAINLG
jgi:hypothetical protein